jgi:hypothetical protein
MLDSIASCGAQYVEPAFIVGYTEPFDENLTEGQGDSRCQVGRLGSANATV